MMANLSEDIQCTGSDTRPPMLDKTDFESWQQRIRLYCLGKDNGVNILKSIDECPFKMGKFRETLAEGLPKDIYTLINHYTDAIDIYDNVKMLLEGSELTKDERESQLCDEFEHFHQNKRETIHEYYVRFTKLINDMRSIKMTMPKMQLNSKFVNKMLPEWATQAHANENKMMLERYNQHAIDPLALVSNVSSHQYPSQSSTNLQSTYVPPVTYQPQFANNTQLDSGFTPTNDLIENLTKTVALLAQSCKTHLPQTNNQLRTSSNTRNQVHFKMAGLSFRMFRVDRTEVRGIMLGEQLTHSKKLHSTKATIEFRILQGQDVADASSEEWSIQDLALNEDNVFQSDQCDAFDSDVDEAPTAQTMFMANLSSTDPIYDEAGPSYDSDILSEVQDHDNYVDSVGEYHDVHKMQNDVQPNYVVDSDAEYTSDSNIILYGQYAKDNAVQVV
ncbi:hypothetical protein Tco_0403666 [Tanacetum coccineum]